MNEFEPCVHSWLDSYHLAEKDGQIMFFLLTFHIMGSFLKIRFVQEDLCIMAILHCLWLLELAHSLDVIHEVSSIDVLHHKVESILETQGCLCSVSEGRAQHV